MMSLTSNDIHLSFCFPVHTSSDSYTTKMLWGRDFLTMYKIQFLRVVQKQGRETCTESERSITESLDDTKSCYHPSNGFYPSKNVLKFSEENEN